MGEADRRAGEAAVRVLAGLLLRADGSEASCDLGLMLMLVSLVLRR
jgi:hypothetical protein